MVESMKLNLIIYLTWKKGDPTVHKRLKFNGVEIEFAPLSVNL